MTDRETDNVLALTTRAQHLQGFFQQSHRRANAETAVKVAGATAKHCVVLHGKSTFLSGTSSSNDFDHECYTRANVACSRASDLTVSACPVNMQGTTGACTVTPMTSTFKAYVQGEFPVDWKWVSESMAHFHTGMQPQPLWWIAPHLPCRVPSRTLPAAQAGSHTTVSPTKGEKSLTNSTQCMVKYTAAVSSFGNAADGCTEPDWFALPDGCVSNAWKPIHAARRGGDRFSAGSGVRCAFGQLVTLPIKPRNIVHKVSLTESSSAEDEENPPPSEVPEPASQSHALDFPTLPITISSTEEEQADSQKEATEPLRK